MRKVAVPVSETIVETSFSSAALHGLVEEAILDVEYHSCVEKCESQFALSSIELQINKRKEILEWQSGLRLRPGITVDDPDEHPAVLLAKDLRDDFERSSVGSDPVTLSADYSHRIWDAPKCIISSYALELVHLCLGLLHQRLKAFCQSLSRSGLPKAEVVARLHVEAPAITDVILKYRLDPKLILLEPPYARIDEPSLCRERFRRYAMAEVNSIQDEIWLSPTPSAVSINEKTSVADRHQAILAYITFLQEKCGEKWTRKEICNRLGLSDDTLLGKWKRDKNGTRPTKRLFDKYIFGQIPIYKRDIPKHVQQKALSKRSL